MASVTSVTSVTAATSGSSSGAGELTDGLGAFREVQRLACAEAAAAQLRPGVTEREVARMQREWLRERGVRDRFPLPFAWFGDRPAFVSWS